MTVSVGEQLIDNYQVTELPDDRSTTANSSSQQHLVEIALLACIEFLESQLEKLQNDKKSTDLKPFSVDQIKQDDYQVSFYTGFPSFAVFLEFYQFLGPAVDKLPYLGTKPDARKRHRSTKLTPMDRLLMTLVKLRLDLKFVDLAF